MLTSSVIEGTSIVTVTYEGALSSDDMSSMRELLHEMVQEHGSASLLVEYGEIDWGRIEPEAAWQDVKSLGMLGDIDRVAIVTDLDWVRNLARGADAVTPLEAKTFAADQRDEAVAWLTS